MEKHKTCSIIGHREINFTQELINKLKSIIYDLIFNKNVSCFLFGSKSEFNFICYSIINDLKLNSVKLQKVVYTCKHEQALLEINRTKFEKISKDILNDKYELMYFDKEVKHKTRENAGKSSYVQRNQAMINDSDYCLFFFNPEYLPPKRKFSSKSASSYQPKSGTAIAYSYAKQKNKTIINVF